MSNIVKQFAEGTASHTVELKLDNGTYRHLVCSRGGSSVYRFEIVTFPGYLAYVGDMGEYVFHRLVDMFDFFRGDTINPDYWAEKCEAAPKREGVDHWSAAEFARDVRQAIRDRLDLDDGESIPEWAEELVAPALQADDERDAREYLDAITDSRLNFSDWWEVKSREYTHHFLWCCHAIQWAIRKYDEQRANP